MKLNIEKSNNSTIKYIFMGVFVVGALIITICGFYEFIILPVILTACLMIFYYVQVSIILNNKKTISYEQFADSNYYLGFLFTLVSLAITLTSLTVSSDNMNILISQFGVAILTTLVGLFLRIYIINFIPNEDANRESFDLIISQKLQMIDKQITQNIDRNKLFSDVVDEKISMFQQKTEENLTIFTDNLIKNLDITKISNIITQISTSMEKNYGEQTKILNSLVSEVKKVNDNYMTSLVNVSQNVQENYKFIDDFKNSLTEVIGKIDQNNGAIIEMNKDYTNSTNKLNELIKSHLVYSEKNTISISEKLNEKNNENILIGKSINEVLSKLSNSIINLNSSKDYAAKQYELLEELIRKSDIYNNTNSTNNERLIEELAILKSVVDNGLLIFKKTLDSNSEIDIELNSNVKQISLELKKLVKPINNNNRNHEE